MWIPLKNKNNQILGTLNGNSRPLFTAYRNQFGAVASQAVNRIISHHQLNPGITAGWSENACLNTADMMITLETRHGADARTQLNVLLAMMAQNRLHTGVAGPNILPEATYGAAVGDAAVIKAAKWIVHGSNSLNHAAHDAPVAATLTQCINLGLGRTMMDLNAINHAFNFAAVPPPFRGIDMGGGQLPAPPTGLAILQQNITAANLQGFAPANAAEWVALACVYLGSIIRAHGFPDQNGRTGRALYALCYLWGGVAFQAVTPAFEQTLHQL